MQAGPREALERACPWEPFHMPLPSARAQTPIFVVCLDDVWIWLAIRLNGYGRKWPDII